MKNALLIALAIIALSACKSEKDRQLDMLHEELRIEIGKYDSLLTERHIAAKTADSLEKIQGDNYVAPIQEIDASTNPDTFLFSRTLHALGTQDILDDFLAFSKKRQAVIKDSIMLIK